MPDTKYQCPLCGTMHHHPEAVTNCVNACRKKQVDTEREARIAIEAAERAKLAAAKNSRWGEVEATFTQALELQSEFLKDYPGSAKKYNVYYEPFHPSSIFSLLF